MPLISTFKLLWVQAKTVPKSCMVVLRETRKVLYIRSKPFPERTRFENELVRSNGESLNKFIAFSVLQAPPGIGMFVIYLALMKYPKYLLTPHFWNEQQLHNFRRHESDFRLIYACKYIMVQDNTLQYSRLLQSGYNVSRLASTHGLFHYEGIDDKMAYSMLPLWFVRYKLTKRVEDIIVDDLYLWSEKSSSGSECKDIEMTAEVLRDLDQKARGLLNNFKAYTGWSQPVAGAGVDLHRAVNMFRNVLQLTESELDLVLLRRGIPYLDMRTMAEKQRALMRWLIAVYLVHTSSSTGSVFVDAWRGDRLWSEYPYKCREVVYPYMYLIAVNPFLF